MRNINVIKYKKHRLEMVLDGEHTRMLLNGEHKRFSLTVDWVAQQSVWLVNMQIEIDGQKWNSPEYMYTLHIDHEMLAYMCSGLEDGVNGLRG